MIDERPMRYYEVQAGEQIRKRQEVAYSMAMVLTLSGRGGFWRIDVEPRKQWDDEQEVKIAEAVREAMADETFTAEQAWEHIKARVRREGEKYAAWRAEEAE